MSAPQSSQIEVSVFGPGFGECTVVHIGDNRWIIVDSCIDRDTKRPVALQYLEEISVSFDRVELIVVTHWHDDHVRGMADLVSACPNARVCISPILCNKEFVASMLAHDERSLTKISSGTHEMCELLESRNGAPLIRGYADRRIAHFEGREFSHNCPVEVWTLSPCDKSYYRFLQSLQKLVPQTHSAKRRIAAIAPNECSVVVLINIGVIAILLGADLEEDGGCKGWTAILEASGRPQVKASFFKVPHHGSANAHHPEVWRHMLSADPVCALAPYNRGTKLPRLEDVTRLTGLSNRIFATAKLVAKPVKRDATVDKILKDFGMKISPIMSGVGQIRGRASDPSTNQFDDVQLFKGARALRDIYQ